MTTNKPLFLAHRGDTKNFPENTLESFTSAFEKGADGIELDVHLSNNQEVIVVHNYSYDKNQEYPLLSTVFEQFKDKGLLEIELKSFDLNCITAVKTLIDLYQVDNFKLTTSIQPLIHHLRAAFPTADIGVIFRRWLLEEWMTEEFICDWTLAHLELSGANYLHLDLDQCTLELVNRLHQEGFKAHTHLKTANRQELEKMLALGVDTCTFDDIDVLTLVK